MWPLQPWILLVLSLLELFSRTDWTALMPSLWTSCTQTLMVSFFEDMETGNCVFVCVYRRVRVCEPFYASCLCGLRQILGIVNVDNIKYIWFISQWGSLASFVSPVVYILPSSLFQFTISTQLLLLSLLLLKKVQWWSFKTMVYS